MLFLFFTIFAITLLVITAVVRLVFYLLNKVRDAVPKPTDEIHDNYGPVGEDKGIDEQ
ncbi:MAG: hypothetical protein K6F21_06805 [Bacteroidales bacterium]|nr:hypothetical protein [Bacteroidales bacterium]